MFYFDNDDCFFKFYNGFNVVFVYEVVGNYVVCFSFEYFICYQFVCVGDISEFEVGYYWKFCDLFEFGDYF